MLCSLLFILYFSGYYWTFIVSYYDADCLEVINNTSCFAS